MSLNYSEWIYIPSNPSLTCCMSCFYTRRISHIYIIHTAVVGHFLPSCRCPRPSHRIVSAPVPSLSSPASSPTLGSVYTIHTHTHTVVGVIIKGAHPRWGEETRKDESAATHQLMEIHVTCLCARDMFSQGVNSDPQHMLLESYARTQKQNVYIPSGVFSSCL